MLRGSEVNRITKEVLKLFNEEPDYHVDIKSGKVTYEIVIYAPRTFNVGRGASLSAALNHLKSLNHL